MSQQTIVSIYTEKKFKQESKNPLKSHYPEKTTLNFDIHPSRLFYMHR